MSKRTWKMKMAMEMAMMTTPTNTYWTRTQMPIFCWWALPMMMMMTILLMMMPVI